MGTKEKQLALLAILAGFGAWLWFSETGKSVAASAGSAIATGVQKVIDLANSTLQLIKGFEGFSSIPYPDASGFSIGYGHFIKPGENLTKLTEPEAYELLRSDTQRFANTVRSYVTVPLSQNQFDALVSFTYNVGESAFRNSTLLRMLNDGDYAGAAEQFARWNKSQGKVLPVLVARREKEKQIFLS